MDKPPRCHHPERKEKLKTCYFCWHGRPELECSTRIMRESYQYTSKFTEEEKKASTRAFSKLSASDCEPMEHSCERRGEASKLMKAEK